MQISNRSLRRWHRWLGLLVAIPALVLSLTGLLLNHLDGLGLRHRALPLWLAGVYGIDNPLPVYGVEQAGQWWSQAAGHLYRDAAQVADCPDPFTGVVASGGLVVVGCADSLLLVSPEGELVERLGRDFGIPGFHRLGVGNGGVVVETAAGPVQIDLERLTLKPWSEAWQPSTPQPVPASLRESLPGKVPAEINWERLLLDVHAGRVLPWVGTLLMDLSALLILVLAISGVWIWFRRPR